MTRGGFKIDLSESFEHLRSAPIVEAVIHWQARSDKKLEPAAMLQYLKEQLPDYPNVQRQQEIGVNAEIGVDGSSLLQRQNWHGFRFDAADKRHIAQFTRNGFVFSRLSPYENWATFEAEAQRLWRVYCELAEPIEVQRLGVRFINLIPLASPSEIDELLTIPPGSPESMQLSLNVFMHQSTFDVPDHPYKLNVIQTIQPSSPPETQSFGLILDLDVFTTRPIQFGEIDSHLQLMQWLKNKAFFSFLTERAIDRFRE